MIHAKRFSDRAAQWRRMWRPADSLADQGTGQPASSADPSRRPAHETRLYVHVFFISLTTLMPLSALCSLVTHITERYDERVYECTVGLLFLPALPCAMAQLRFDRAYDRKARTRRSHDTSHQERGGGSPFKARTRASPRCARPPRVREFTSSQAFFFRAIVACGALSAASVGLALHWTRALLLALALGIGASSPRSSRRPRPHHALDGGDRTRATRRRARRTPLRFVPLPSPTASSVAAAGARPLAPR